MTTDEPKIDPELDVLIARLTEPFAPSEIRWRVTHTTQDGHRGAVIAFADPRAYTDRLNQIFTPIGWTRDYEVTTISAVSRVKRDKVIQTGKVLVTCSLTIHRLGSHTGSGEEWADEPWAMTASEAQAFKRACVCFGLGRYLYNVEEVWVPLNEHGRPLSAPSLPSWALPKSANGGNLATPTPRSQAAQRGPIDQQTTARIEGFRRILGDPIYSEILWRSARARRASTIPNAQLQAKAAEAMERASRGVRKVHSLAETVGETQFVSTLNRLHIASTSAIPNLEALRRLASELEGLAGRSVA
jgi:hypothetical protein